MMVPNIAFTGKVGAGKTTAARLLVEEFDLGFEVISFATPLKKGLGTETDRQRLQEFGTDVVRAYDPDFWVRLFWWHLELRTQLRQALDDAPLDFRAIRWANDDCRFENELLGLQDAGWSIIEVRAPVGVRAERLKRNGKLTDESQLNHSSEHGMPNLVPDGIIHNVGSETELLARLGAAINFVRSR